MQDKKISVITVAYKNSKVVVDLLNSIAKYNDIGNELEVIIVDNSPEDARIEEVIKVADYKNYIYIKADNKGFGAGNNRGAGFAKGEILAFLNPDIILIEPVFKKIYDKFKEDNKLALMGCKLLDKKLKTTLSFSYMPEFDNHFYDGKLCLLFNKLGFFNPRKFYIHGADLIMSKRVYSFIGGFDENIFMYDEEPDITHQIQKLLPDMHIKYYSDIKMIHLGGASSDIQNTWKIMSETDLYYFNKYNLDFCKYIKSLYFGEKFKFKIETLFCPQKAQRRKKYIIKMIEKQFPEIIN